MYVNLIKRHILHPFMSENFPSHITTLQLIFFYLIMHFNDRAENYFHNNRCRHAAE